MRERGLLMKLKLLVMTKGTQEGKVLEVKLSQFVIGRDPQCHLRPASPVISKRHCAIIQKNETAYVRDFGSTNGTFLNDERIEGEVELHNDDVLKIGPIEFKVQLQTGAPINRATPAPPTKGAEKKPKLADKTPLPETKDAPKEEAAGEEGGEDDIAAMLLSLQDDSSDASIPDGTTALDMHVPPELLGSDQASAPKKDEAQVKEDEKKKNIGNTSSAAKDLLEKYMRRPRT
jgi:pSer/pThr/pTyr-binding forkhead associated (FHA) protein